MKAYPECMPAMICSTAKGICDCNRRPGDKRFFGDTAAAVFEKSPGSVLFLSS